MATSVAEDEVDGLGKDDVITFEKISKDYYFPVRELPKTENRSNVSLMTCKGTYSPVQLSKSTILPNQHRSHGPILAQLKAFSCAIPITLL